jgi:hypothetical protein
MAAPLIHEHAAQHPYLKANAVASALLAIQNSPEET